MLKTNKRFKTERICWRQFTRKHDAIFRSLGKEMSIGVLSVSTLLFACPESAAAKVAVSNADKHNSDTKIEELSAIEADSLIELEGTEVVASRAPLPADKAVRLVQVITRKEIEASSALSVNDLLKQSAGVDVRQRGGFGVQTDIGVNGGSSDQLTVLLNGVNITNPHTGHLTVDLPVSVDDIERIEVLEGGASRVYGSSAFSGAINIVTRSEKTSSINANLTAGSYGTWGGNANISLKSGNFTNRVSGSYTQSDGNCNNDFKKATGYWNGTFNSSLWDVKTQFGLSHMDYGANTFYSTGSNTQYEEGRRYIASVQAEYKGKVHILPQAYWNRSLDHYVWTRSNPAVYQNFHQTNVYGANLNAYTTWALGKTAIGIEYRKEHILSSKLGKDTLAVNEKKVPGHDEYYKYSDSRDNLGIYLEHDVLLKNVTISLGVLANYNSSVEGGMKFYPGVDVSWRVCEPIKIYASFNQSLRTPTFTDLYYNGPGIEGNPNLKPEKSTDFSVGMNFSSQLVNVQVKGFYRMGTDMMDWVKFSGATSHTVVNSDINDIGAEAIANFNFTNVFGAKSWVRFASLGYCYNYKNRVNEEQSAKYVNDLSFLRHKLTATLNHRIFSRLTAQWDFRMKNRNGEFDNATTGQRQKYGTYANLDLRLNWEEKHFDIYASLNNLTNHKYFDIANVEQPGLWVMGGIKLKFGL